MKRILFYLSFAFGIFPLSILVFGLLKPARFRKSLRNAFAPAAIGLGLCLVAVVALTVITRESEYGPLFLIFAIPLLLVLLISLSGINTLAERVAPAPGIALSLLCAAGCPALAAGVSLLISFGFRGEAGMALYFFTYGGGMTATIITLAYALQKWIGVVRGIPKA